MIFRWVKGSSQLLRARMSLERRFCRLAVLATALGALGVNCAVSAPVPLTFTQLLACPVDGVAFNADTLPENIRAILGQPVQITGYMLPLVVEKGRARQLLVMRNTMACCYGQPPAPNEYVVVKVPPPGLPVTMDVPVAMQGTLRVEPVKMGGLLVEFFHLDNATAVSR